MDWNRSGSHLSVALYRNACLRHREGYVILMTSSCDWHLYGKSTDWKNRIQTESTLKFLLENFSIDFVHGEHYPEYGVSAEGSYGSVDELMTVIDGLPWR